VRQGGAWPRAGLPSYGIWLSCRLSSAPNAQPADPGFPILFLGATFEMTDDQILEILRLTRTIATVGLSTSPAKVSYGVAAYLQHQGYRVIPINPRCGTILGETAYPDLASVPEPVDLVQVFRPAEEVPAIARQAVEKGAKVLWMQEGIVSAEAKDIAERAGLLVVMDRCLRVEHKRLVGRRDPPERPL